jgi:MFS transporter, ACS family, DAL5 transporter family protein
MNDNHDTEKGHELDPKIANSLIATSDDEVLQDTTADLYVDPVAERKLVLKLDVCLSPVMTMIFLAAYLDRSNIGNAASAGVTTDLHLKGNQLGSEFPASQANNPGSVTDSSNFQMP